MFAQEFNDFLAIYKACRDADQIETVICNDAGTLSEFKVRGFSKSGTVTVKYVVPEVTDPMKMIEPKIIVYQRYDRETEIRNYDELAFLAWDWYIDYADRGYHVPEEWKQYFLDHKLIREKKTTTYEIVR